MNDTNNDHDNGALLQSSSSSGAEGGGGAQDISPARMAVAAVPIVVVTLLSLHLKLGQNVRTLLLASTRCVGQLLLLGLMLVPVFRHNQPYTVLSYLLVMITFATREAGVKPKHYYNGMTRHIFVALTTSVTVSLAVISFGVLHPNPWYDAQIIIPVGGMMLGSCVNALSLGLDRFLVHLRGPDDNRGSAKLQTLLAVGATPWETSLDSIRQAIETGLTPNLNQMSVMGLVSIPGMLTGQLLSGTPPLVAAKYQIVIMFFVCANSTITLLLVLCQAVFGKLFQTIDRRHCSTFQSNLTHKRSGGKPKDILVAFLAQLGNIADFAWRVLWGDPKGDKNVHELEEEQDEGRTDNKNDTNEDIETKAIVDNMTKQMTTGTGTFLRAVAGGNEGKGEFKGFAQCTTHNNATNKNPQPNNDRTTAGRLLLRLTDGAMNVSGTPLLSNVNMEVHQGEILFLTGPSGCGKSTLLRALAKLEALDQGRLSWHGRPTTPTSNNRTTKLAWRTEVLYVRQNGGQGLQGTPLNLLEDLCSLEALGLRFQGMIDNIANRLEQHLQSLDLASKMLNMQWSSLSGGESQRVYLCLMVALQPSILLLDEPTSACDEASAVQVEALIVASGIATVWVSHDASQIERLQQLSQTSVLKYCETKSPEAEAETRLSCIQD